ncbi:MAG: ammonia-forming cytochrome c nitrite reductase subunit c552 [Promethearchaeota archaeon]
MVYYKEVPEVNKRMVAGYYLFLCLIGFAILLGPTGSGIPITLVGNPDRYEHDMELAFPSPGVDNLTCGGPAPCHEDVWLYWNESGHADEGYEQTFNGTYVIGLHGERNATYYNSTCAPCHATGYDPAGNDGNGSWVNLGITCLACHDVTQPYVTYNGTVCGNCHNPGYHASRNEYPEWQNSAHANSLMDLRTSSHASSNCMHCMSTEGFIHQQNPGSLSDYGDAAVDLGFDPAGNYSSISCPACHAVHSNWTAVEGNAQIRAVNTSELCGLCHNGHHPQYDIWIGGTHNLAGVTCTDCHGYSLVFDRGAWRYDLNHTFALDPDIACGQARDVDELGCHEGMDTWALGQLEMREDAYLALTQEITAEAESMAAEVATYNATEGANVAAANAMQAAIDEAESLIDYFGLDGSSGFHDGTEIFAQLNGVYADLLDAKATFYQTTAEGVTVTVTNTVTTTVTVIGGDTLLLVGGSVGGIVIGLVLGVLVGRRR